MAAVEELLERTQARIHSHRQFEEPAAPEPEAGMGSSIVNELVKSFGFRYDEDPNTGQYGWSWSLENIAKSFEEDPVWTSIDYLLMAVPVAKWGSAAYKVSSASRGTSAAKRAYQAGALGEEAAATRAGRMFESAGRQFGAGAGFGRAVELERRFGAPRTNLGFRFSSMAARREDDPDWLKLVEQAGGRDPFEERALYSVMQREAAQEAEMYGRMAEDLIRQQNRALRGPQERRQFVEALKQGAEPGSREALELVGKDAEKAYRNTWNFRLLIHNEGYEMGLFGEETYEAGLKTYFPRVYQEYEAARRGQRGRRARRGAQARAGSAAAGRERFLGRKLSEEDVAKLEGGRLLTVVLDPAVGAEKLAEAGMFVAKQRFLQRLATSAVVKTPDEVIEHFDALFRAGPGDPSKDALRSAYRAVYGDEAVGRVLAATDPTKVMAAERRGMPGLVQAEHDELMKVLGWRSMDEILSRQRVPGYLKDLPEEFRGKYIDPFAADDILGVAKIADLLPEGARRFYMTSLGWFKASKTAYNPATHFRNLFGAVIFHHATVGGAGAFSGRNPMFKRGRKALADGPGNDDFHDIADSGLLGSAYDREIHEAMERGLGSEIGKEVTAMDWLFRVPGIGSSWVTQKAVAAASRAERLYRWTDEVAKADAFLTRRDYWKDALKRQGFDGDIALEAKARAAQDVVKFQPVFSQNSPFTNMVRNAVPFASFTTEAVRVWKNIMLEKPHLAFFWNHAVEGMSHAMGAAAGFSEEDLAASKEALPYFMKGKKMLTIPFRVDGKPVFLDMSYMIPLANIVEAAQAEATFFDTIMIDPFTNPFASMGAAVSTGLDPFSKRKVEPRALERMGAPIPEGGAGRRAAGLVEHALKLALPPLVPPGYAGVNLWELARGKRHPSTGAELEQGVIRTLAANLAGMRVYEADVNSQLLNIRREERLRQEKASSWWDRWKWAAANGDPQTMRRAVEEIKALRRQRGDSEEDIASYIEQGIKRREPGKFRTVSTKQLQEVLQRSEGIGYLDDDDRAMLAELTARMQERESRWRKVASK